MTTMEPPPTMGDPIAPPGKWTFYADGSVPPYTPFGQVQCDGFTCSWELSAFGAGEAILPVDGNALTRQQLLGFYSWRLWALYNGEPVWAGLPTGLSDDGQATVKVALVELPGYLMRKAYAQTGTYNGVEQTTIAADLAARLSNIGVPIVTSPGPGRNRDRSYKFLEGDSRGSMLTELCQVTNGPEFRAEYGLDSGGLPVCTFKIAYPTVGRTGDASGLALPVPGGAVSFQLDWSGEAMRTRTFAIGDLPDNSSTTALKPVQFVNNPQAGVPPLDGVDDWPGVVLTSALADKAATAATIDASPQVSLSAVLPLNAPPLDSYGVGDDVSVSLSDPLYPAGFSTTGQLTKIECDAHAGTATWTVSITRPHKRKRTLHARLVEGEIMTKKMLHKQLTQPTGIGEP